MPQLSGLAEQLLLRKDACVPCMVAASGIWSTGMHRSEWLRAVYGLRVRTVQCGCEPLGLGLGCGPRESVGVFAGSDTDQVCNLDLFHERQRRHIVAAVNNLPEVAR